jgi:hypothetical protein
VRATKPELFSPRRDGGLDLLPFLDASRLSVSLRKQSGDTWQAALRPFKPVPVLVPLAFASLPNRDTDSSASPPKLSPQSVVRIDEHGSKDRAKDASLRQARSLVRAVRCMPLWRMLMTFPSSATFGHPLSSVRPHAVEEPLPARRTDPGLHSSVTPRRVPPSRKPGCLSPARARRKCREGIAPSGLHAGSLAHAAHTFPRDGERAVDGHCKVTVRSPADP